MKSLKVFKTLCTMYALSFRNAIRGNAEIISIKLLWAF